MPILNDRGFKFPGIESGKETISLKYVLEALGVNSLNELHEKLNIVDTSISDAVEELIDLLIKSNDKILVNNFAKYDNFEKIAQNQSLACRSAYCGQINRFVKKMIEVKDSKKYLHLLATSVFYKIITKDNNIYFQIDRLDLLFQSLQNESNQKFRSKCFKILEIYFNKIQAISFSELRVLDLITAVFNLGPLTDNDLKDLEDILEMEGIEKQDLLLSSVTPLIEHNIIKDVGIMGIFKELKSICDSTFDNKGRALTYITTQTLGKQSKLEYRDVNDEQATTKKIFNDFSNIIDIINRRPNGGIIFKNLVEYIQYLTQNVNGTLKDLGEYSTETLSISDPDFLLDLINSGLSDETILDVLKSYREGNLNWALRKNKDVVISTVLNKSFVLNFAKTFDTSFPEALSFILSWLGREKMDDAVGAEDLEQFLINLNQFSDGMGYLPTMIKSFEELPKEFRHLSFLNKIYNREKDQNRVYAVVSLLKNFKFEKDFIDSLQFVKPLVSLEGIDQSLSIKSDDLYKDLSEKYLVASELKTYVNEVEKTHKYYSKDYPKSWLDAEMLEYIFNKFGNNSYKVYNFFKTNLSWSLKLGESLKKMVDNPKILKIIVDISDPKNDTFRLFTEYINVVILLQNKLDSDVLEKYLKIEFWESLFSEKSFTLEQIFDILQKVSIFAPFLKYQSSLVFNLPYEFLDLLFTHQNQKAWEYLIANFDLLCVGKKEEIHSLIQKNDLDESQMDTLIVKVCENYSSIFDSSFSQIYWFVKSLKDKLSDKNLSRLNQFIVDNFNTLLDKKVAISEITDFASSFNLNQNQEDTLILDLSQNLNQIYPNDGIGLHHNIYTLFKELKDCISDHNFDVLLRSVVDNFDDIFRMGDDDQDGEIYNIIYFKSFLELIETRLNSEHCDIFLDIFNKKFCNRIFYPESNQPPNFNAFVNNTNLQKKSKNKEYLQEYGRNIIKFIYKNPACIGRLFHVVAEVQSILNNSESNTDPVLTQQNIIQISAFALPDAEVDSFSVGSMFVSSLGYLDNNLKLNHDSHGDSYSPHPDFESAVLRSGKNSYKLFTIKEWDKKPALTIKNKDKQGSIINSINVRPIGIDVSLYY